MGYEEDELASRLLEIELQQPLGFYNTNISSNGSQAITDAVTILRDAKWTDVMNKIEDDSNQYGHDCGTLPFDATKSKDTDSVEKLNLLRYNTNSLKDKFIDFTRSIYTNNNNSCYAERMRVIGSMKIATTPFPNRAGLDTLPGSQMFLTPSEVASRTDYEQNTRKSDIDGKVAAENANSATENARTARENKRKTNLDTSQAEIVREFEAKKTELNGRIGVLEAKISEAGGVKSDRNEKVTMLTTLEANVNSQKALSSAVSTSLASAAAVNTEQLKYLTDRTTKTQGIAVDGYEELYKAVILQNELLEVAKSEMENNISSTQRESKYVSKKRTFIYDIYIKLYAVYYILIIFFIGFLIFYKKLWSIYYKIALIVVGIIYPLCILTVESWIYNCWLYVLSLLTGSVYVYRPL